MREGESTSGRELVEGEREREKNERELREWKDAEKITEDVCACCGRRKACRYNAASTTAESRDEAFPALRGSCARTNRHSHASQL